MRKPKTGTPARIVDVERVESAWQHASDATGAFRSPTFPPEGASSAHLPASRFGAPPEVAVTPDDAPAAPEKKSWRNPDDDIKREAESVAKLMETLREMGVSCAESIEASINSETNFREMVEARLRVEGEIDAMVTGLKGYIETLQERVKKFESTKKAIRQVLLNAFVNAGQTNLPTAYGTVYTKPGSYSLNVTNEAIVNTSFFKWTIDTATLKERLTERLRAEEAVNKIADDEARAKAREEFNAKYPPIEGAELQQGDTTLAIRRK